MLQLANPKKVKVLERKIFPCELCKKKFIGTGDTCTRYLKVTKEAFAQPMEFMYVCIKCSKKIETQKGLIDETTFS